MPARPPAEANSDVTDRSLRADRSRPDLRTGARLLAVFAGLLLLISCSTIFGTNGVVRLLEFRAQSRALEDCVFRLLQRNERLRQRIIRFHQDDGYLEALARSRLGLVRDREIVYRFSSSDAPAPLTTPPQGRR